MISVDAVDVDAVDVEPVDVVLSPGPAVLPVLGLVSMTAGWVS